MTTKWTQAKREALLIRLIAFFVLLLAAAAMGLNARLVSTVAPLSRSPMTVASRDCGEPDASPQPDRRRASLESFSSAGRCLQ